MRKWLFEEESCERPDEIRFGRKTVTLLAGLWIIILVASISVSLTLIIAGGTGTEYGDLIDSQRAMLERYARLETVRQHLVSEYYVEVDSDRLVQGAIDGMMASLGDPYTFYYTPERMAEQKRNNAGTYVGVGMLVGSASGELVVLRVFTDSSAYDVGIRTGDVILSVDGEAVKAVDRATLDEASAKLKGEAGTWVQLRIRRASETFEVSVERRAVTASRVRYQIMSNGMGYIDLDEFQGDAVEGVRTALQAFKEAGVAALVFDVRNNPGGLLSDAVAICDMLLPKGVIVYTEDRSGQPVYYRSDEACFAFSAMAVLVNGSSASASEIFAAALQEYDIAEIVGTTTFGKGIVQTPYEFYEDGGGMQLTTAVYYTPNGRSIHGVGITPDVEVLPANGDILNGATVDPRTDLQLETAIDVLNTALKGKEVR